MSLIAMQGGATGTGTVTLLAPITNTTQTLTLPDATGTVQVSGSAISGTTGTFSGLIAANGGGVSFPATQVPSADANTLDDYEEGTWTPTLSFLSGSVTYTTQTGRYVKIGKLVTVQAYIKIAAVSSPSTFILMQGIPFTPAVPDVLGTAAIMANAMLTTVAGGWVASPRTSDIRIWTYTGGVLTNAAANLQATSEFWLTCSYEV